MNYWRQDSKGRWHRVITQEYDYSCAMACCAMLASAYKGRYIREATFIQGNQGMLGYKAGSGTFAFDNIASLLRAEGVNNIYDTLSGSTVISQLEPYLSPSKLAMVQVAWNNGGLHMVVVGRVYPTDGLTVMIDPWWQIGLVEQNRDDFPSYYGNLGRLTGSNLLAV
ncbi:MAG: hypothetical protein GTO60_10645 [Gammaproteobacteria bacterium]|nr:hypothetical protein [Gammaproteobacteria bacterium]NIO62937.1 hypothetical protein [Gammaproteobacteria bacterium]